MKEIDDTNPTKINECEDCDRLAHYVNKVTEQFREHALVCEARIQALESMLAGALELRVRVAHLETQRTPQDNNEDDAEWY